MANDWLRWAILFALTIVVAFLAFRTPYFPGDIALAKFIQSLSGENVGWARLVTNLVNSPWNFILLTITAAAAWWMSTWRGAIIALLSFNGMFLAEQYLKPLLARPRPSPQLIHVVGTPSGFSFPSGFGLLFCSMIGLLAILACHKFTGKSRMAVIVLCGALLLLGGCARVTLGAHWPSDIIGAYLCSSTWVYFLLLLNRAFFPTRVNA